MVEPLEVRRGPKIPIKKPIKSLPQNVKAGPRLPIKTEE